ncbi:Leucine-rich repeat-containing protein 71 [Rhizophlyctis rosea]|uniref:Leucine-rich repeat-containing protein 71 n=1 Tax=Rhizophlyctis rosea TaxID=64517 RepID=A0AAD5X6R4_9FUNG|nr:Leucine-rich repeat-containing protein 71 [Rhizophlyctis rosea]
MAVDTDERTEAQDYTGNFDADYLEACRRNNLKPMHLLRIGHPLPPIPILLTPRAQTPPPNNHQSLPPPEDEPSAVDGSLGRDTPDRAEKPAGVMSYHSRFQYKPTINVETGDGDDEDEVFSVQIRGWKVEEQTMEVLASVVPACSSISHLVFWNCGLTSTHFTTLQSLIATTAIRSLSLDMNPQIPEHLYSSLLTIAPTTTTDDLQSPPQLASTTLQSLSLRSNNLTDQAAKSLGQALKTNRVLTSLNLWNNRIGKEGAEALADALRTNGTLGSLNLGSNNVADEGAVAFAKALSNYALSHDEIMARRKTIGDLDKQRKDQEDDFLLKKGKKGIANRRMSSAKLPMSAQQPSTESIKSKDLPADKTKGAAKPGAKPGKAAPASAAAPPPPASADKGGSKKTPDAGGGAGAAKGGKGGMGMASSASVGLAAGPGDKSGKDKDKKGAAAGGAPAKGGKKGKVEEMKEEIDEAADTVNTGIEPMFELNGVWYVLGNRTLNNLNLSRNGIREEGVKALLDAVLDQAAADDNAGEGLVGVFRITLQDNLVDSNSPVYQQLVHLLNTRNPYFEQPETDGSGDATQEGGGDGDHMEADSAIEEETS